MLPSPASSLSSFRDYYRHTSEASEDYPSNERLLLQGLANFQIAKVFARADWRLNQQRYWACFHAFRKMAAQHSRRGTKARATQLFGKLLKARAHRESKIGVQVGCLNEMLEHVREARSLELAKLRQFGMRFMRKNYTNAALSYRQVIDKLSGRPRGQKVSAERAKYIMKLSKAVLCIVLRNTIDKKLFWLLREVRDGQPARSRPSQIPFFKPKKEKFYEHKREDKLHRLLRLAALATLLQKKIFTYFKTFLSKIALPQESSALKILEDSREIFANVVQHMIYLTAAASKIQSEPTKSQLEQLKLFKLRNVLRKERRRQREGARECLLAWRRAANEQHLQLRREILKLEMIKKHYMEEF